jgi:hypothetical protein
VAISGIVQRLTIFQRLTQQFWKPHMPDFVKMRLKNPFLKPSNYNGKSFYTFPNDSLKVCQIFCGERESM